MRRSRFLALVCGLVGLLVSAAFAADCPLAVHADRRLATSKCWTWGNYKAGVYRAVVPYARASTQWSTTESNYPVGSKYEGDCWYYYQSPTPPKANPGEWLLWGLGCESKHYYVRRCVGGSNAGNVCGGNLTCPMGACTSTTETDTSSPIATLKWDADWNGGGESVPSLCTWKPGAYGSTSAP